MPPSAETPPNASSDPARRAAQTVLELCGEIYDMRRDIVDSVRHTEISRIALQAMYAARRLNDPAAEQRWLGIASEYWPDASTIPPLPPGNMSVAMRDRLFGGAEDPPY